MMKYNISRRASGKKLMPFLCTAAVSLVIMLGSNVAYAADEDVIISITKPESEWVNEAYDITLSIDKPESIEIKSVSARFGASGQSVNVTENMVFTVMDNGTLYVTVKDTDGNSYKREFDISYFDLDGPELIAAVDDGLLSINVVDDKSGVDSLIVNGYEYTECQDGTLALRLQQFDASYESFSIYAKDKLGNISDEYVLDNPYFQVDEEKEDGDRSGYLPTNAKPTDANSANGTVTYHATEYGNAKGTGQISSTSENEADEYAGMEFYVVATDSGKTFYVVIDKAQSDHNAYLLTDASEADLLNFTGTESLILPKNGAVIAGTYKTNDEKTAAVTKQGSFNATPDISDEEEPKVQKHGNNNMIMIIVLAVIGGVVIIMFKKKNKKTKTERIDMDDDLEDDEDDDEVED